MRFTGVTFDYWNTLIAETEAPNGIRAAMWIDLLARAGEDTEPERIGDAFGHAWAWFDRAWRRNQPVQPHHTAAQAVSHLGFDPVSSLGEELIAAYLDASLQVPRQLLPNVGEVFDALTCRGIRIGVVCDVGAVESRQLRRWLHELGVADKIDHFSFSDEVGVFKPHPKIFADALAGLGVDPARAVHVGDLRRTDVAGARSQGMTPVRYTGALDDTDDSEPDADHVIADHLELVAILALGGQRG